MRIFRQELSFSIVFLRMDLIKGQKPKLLYLQQIFNENNSFVEKMRLLPSNCRSDIESANKLRNHENISYDN